MGNGPLSPKDTYDNLQRTVTYTNNLSIVCFRLSTRISVCSFVFGIYCHSNETHWSILSFIIMEQVKELQYSYNMHHNRLLLFIKAKVLANIN